MARMVRIIVVTVLVSVAVVMSVSTSAAAPTVDASGASAIGSGSASGSGDSGSSSGSSSGSAQPMLPIPSLRGLTALGWAATQAGKPYRWGGTGPSSWDCSGLVQWAFRQTGVTLPRTTWQQAHAGMAVPRAALAPGDVVVLKPDGSHVGIYVGFGQIFNAYGNGVPVGLSPLRKFHIYAIRRF